MSSPADVRLPLDHVTLDAALARAGSPWRDVHLVAVTGSTNADAAAAARSGAAEGFAVVAEEQTAGRGRLDRRWTAPRGSGVMFSVVLRPGGLPAPAWGWLPLLAGLAALAAVDAPTVRLKWPNDLVVDLPAHDGTPGPRKLGGILAEAVAPPGKAGPGDAAVVVGLGLNVSLAAHELPVPTATSLALEGLQRTRADLVAGVLAALATDLAALAATSGDPAAGGLLDRYRAACLTLGQDVRVVRSGAPDLTGRAVDVDAAGALVLETAAGPTSVTSGDVVHLR